MLGGQLKGITRGNVNIVLGKELEELINGF